MSYRAVSVARVAYEITGDAWIKWIVVIHDDQYWHRRDNKTTQMKMKKWLQDNIEGRWEVDNSAFFFEKEDDAILTYVTYSG